MQDFDVKHASLKGIHLVEANAGTGKTYNISSLFVRLIAETNHDIRELLVLTFTDAATVELRERIQSHCREVLERLQDSPDIEPSNDEFLEYVTQKYASNEKVITRLQHAVLEFDESHISTIHGFCQKLLRDYPFQFGVSPDFELLTNPESLIMDLLRSSWRDFFAPSDSQVQRLFQNTILQTGKGIKSPEDFYSKYGKILYDELPIHPRSALIHAFEDYSNARNIPTSLESFAPYVETEFPASYWEEDEVQEELFHSLTELWIQELRERFSQEKKKRATLDYNDLIRIVSKVINQADVEFLSILRNAFPVALIDEFQDTDTYQFAIFKKLFEGFSEGSLYLIGDPKQAIYGFRGADIHTYLEAKEWVNKDHHYKLSYNYRSNPELLAFTNQFFSSESTKLPFWLPIDYQNSHHPSEKSDKESQEYAKYNNHIWLNEEGTKRLNPIQWIPIPSQTSEQTSAAIMDDLGKRVNYLLNNSLYLSTMGPQGIAMKKIQPSDIAILVHTNFQAFDIHKLLSRNGIPAIINSQESIYQTKESEYIRTWLGILQNPNQEKVINYVLAHPLGGFTAEQLRTKQTDGVFWTNLLDAIYKASEDIQKKDVAWVLRDLFEYLKLYDQWPLNTDFERIVTNIDHLLEIIQRQQKSKGLGLNGLIHFFESQNSEHRIEEDEEIIRLNTDEQMVNIITTHRSKGLQFPIVFCPFEAAGKTPTITNKIIKYRIDGNQYYDIRLVASSKNLHATTIVPMMREEIANRIRLAYVSITRAESLCFLYNHTGMSGWSSGLLATCMDKELLGSLIESKMRSPRTAPKSSSDKHADTLASHISGTLDELNAPFKAWSSSELPAIKTELHSPNHVAASVDLKLNELQTPESLQNYRRIHSYSSLKNHQSTAIDSSIFSKSIHVKDDDREDQQSDDYKDRTSIATMPKGAEIGSFFHRLMEQLLEQWVLGPFNYREWVLQESSNFGLNEAHSEHIYSWVHATMNTELIQSCCLKEIAKRQIIVEKPFLIPSDSLQPETLYSLIRGRGNEIDGKSSNNQSLPKGFLKGFIDLVFEHDGKFFVLDYKTNTLKGENAYAPEQLNKAMLDLSFDIQGHLYTLALHKYLSTYMSGYDYDRHFGGYIYVFVRGLHNENPMNGKYHHRPNIQTISDLMAELLPQEGV